MISITMTRMGELLQIHAKTYMLWKMSRLLNPKYTSIYHYPLNYHYFPKLEEGESVVGMLVLTEAEERDKKIFHLLYRLYSN